MKSSKNVNKKENRSYVKIIDENIVSKPSFTVKKLEIQNNSEKLACKCGKSRLKGTHCISV